MRKFFLFALVATMFAACVTDETQDVAIDIAPETLTVSFEGDDSRIQLQNGKTVWTKGDLVSVFYLSNANQKWQFQGETGNRSGELKRIEEGTATESMNRVVVVYPYAENYYINPETCNVKASLPAEQTYLKDSYGLNGNILISQSEFNQFSLKNVCGWLKVQLKGEGQVVKKITLKGNNNEQVAGLIYINSETAEATLASEMGGVDDSENGAGGNLVFDDTILTEVALNCGEGVTLSGTTTTFHIGLPPQTFEKGLTLTVHYSDGTTMKKSTSNSIEIARNAIQPMSTLYYDGNVPPVFELAYTTNDGQPLDPYTTEGFGANFVENVYDAATGQGALKFDGRITTIPEKAFIACGNLTGITLTADIKTIGAAAFNGCSNLAIMDIPNSVTSIGDKAFYNCSGMQEIAILNSAASIGESSFEGCGGKATINCKIGYNSFRKAKFTEVIIGDSVTLIGQSAFYGCTSLTSVTIPDSVTWIGWEAFAACTSLKEVYYKGDLSAWCKIDFRDSYSNPCYNGARLFIDDVEAIEITIPSDVTEIKNYTFRGCTSLTSVTIPDSVTSIGKSAFYECTSLTSVTIPDSVTSIGEAAFRYCTSLTSVTIPDSVTSIGYSAFYSCTSLTSVTIGNGVTSIGYSAFYSCTSLKEVYCKPTTPPTGDNYMFSYYDGGYKPIGCKIYVPKASVEAYKAASYWSDYASDIEGYNF